MTDFRNQLHLTNLLLAVAFVWILITAYCSVGYLHADEHYQLLEFAGLKLGINQQSDLPWEYGAQIRPSFQPYIAFILISGLKWIGLENPFVQTFFLRALTGILFFFSIVFFWKKTKERFNDNLSVWYLALSFFFWFFPYIYVRFSSETWSAFTFLVGVSYLFEYRKKSDVLLGSVFLGLSIIFRIQTLTMVFGFFMWLFFIKKEAFSQLLLWAFIILVVFGFSVVLDFQFYGEPVFTAWNYIRVNLFESKAAEFGVSPWYSYLHYILKYAYGPFGIILIGSFFYVLYKNVKDPFIWIVFPLFFIHSLIGHKEYRFLFPALPFLPIIILTAVKQLGFSRSYLKYLLGILILLNSIALLVSSLKPARHGIIKLVKDIVEIKEDKFTVIHTADANPIDPWGLPHRFYFNELYNEMKLEKVNELSQLRLDNQQYFLALKNNELTESSRKIISDFGFVEYSQSTPQWMDLILEAYGSFNVDQKVILFVRESH